MRKTLLAFALLAATAAMATNTDETVRVKESGAVKEGNMAPSFGGWDVAGRKVLTLDKLRKEPTPSALVVTFGASHCKPCRLGIPRLVQLEKKNAALRLVLVDVEPDQAAAQKFAEEMGVDASRTILDKFEQIAKTYGLKSPDEKLNLPRTFLVDAKGRVRGIYTVEGKDFEAMIEKDFADALAAAMPPPQ
jgi:thiol-disulfide isomerase/thioredoxin